MSWSTNPRMEWLRYYLKKFHVPFLLAPVFITSSLWMPGYYKEAFRAPITATYHRPDAAGVEIALRGDSGEHGLTENRQRVIHNVLDTLPLEHVRQVKFIGVIGRSLHGNYVGRTDGSGAMFFDGRTDGDSLRFAGYLSHEIGHQVWGKLLSDRDKKTWTGYFRHSRDRLDYVSDYALRNKQEDFADSYKRWVGSSYAFQFMATEAAERGGSTLLERYLFMAGVFLGPNQTVKTYGNWVGSESVANGWDSGMTLREFPIRYYRTADTLTIDAYTYRLKGDRIVAIENREGRTIVTGMNVLVPKKLWDRMEYTEPAPLFEPARPLTVMCDPGTEPGTCQSPEIETRFQVTSPNDPRQYVPIESEAGRHAIAGEQATTRDRTTVPTYEDQVRPHEVVISR